MAAVVQATGARAKRRAAGLGGEQAVTIREFVLLYRLYRAVGEGNQRFISWAKQDLDVYYRAERIGRAA